MRLLVCGSRDFVDIDRLTSVLDEVVEGHLVEMVIDGGARGADRMACAWASFRGYLTKTYPADWNRYGRSAGPVRNRHMLKVGQPTLVVAFPLGRLADSVGTLDMVTIARRAGVTTHVFEGPT